MTTSSTLTGVEHWLPWYDITREAVASIRQAEVFAGHPVWKTLDWLNLEADDLVAMTLERLADRGRLAIDPDTLDHPRAYIAKIALNRLREEVADRMRLGHLEDIDSGALGGLESADREPTPFRLIREHRDDVGGLLKVSTPRNPANRVSRNVSEFLDIDSEDCVEDFTAWLIDTEGLHFLICGDRHGTARGVELHEERGGPLCELPGGETAAQFYLSRDADLILLDPEAFEAAVRMRGGYLSCAEFAALRRSRLCERCSTPFTRGPAENARTFCTEKCRNEARSERRRAALRADTMGAR